MAARLELLENTHKNQVDQILPKLAVKGFNQKIAKLKQNRPIKKTSSPPQTPPPFIQRPIRSDPHLKCYRCESSQHLMKDCSHYYCQHCIDWPPDTTIKIACSEQTPRPKNADTMFSP